MCTGSRLSAVPSVLLILLTFVRFLRSQGFVGNAVPPRSFGHFPQQQQTRGQRLSTSLSGKLWDRLQIEEDPEPFWYLLNCIAGLELDLMQQCRASCEDMPDAVKFVVPTERKTRSHGANRMVTEEKVKYPGYVFAKLRLCPEVYEAIQTLDLCRSWMGTVNRKGYKKLPPSPVVLNELEVENFGLEDLEFTEVVEEESDVILDTEENDEESKNDLVDKEALSAYQGLKVEDMVKVTKQGNFLDEDGIVRRLKDGKIFVRFFTYGTMFEEWMEPKDVRPLTNVEVLKGLSGPSQPVTQRDFDGPDDRRDDSRISVRGNLMSGVKGNRGVRNRRQDRSDRGDRYKRGEFNQQQEREREERNWKWYQENRSQQKQNPEPRLGRASYSSDRLPPSQRQVRKDKRQQGGRQSRDFNNAIDGDGDWSAFVSPAPSDSSTPPSEEDAFFASLMSDLSQDLGSSSDKSAKSDGQSPSSESEDDFFSSLTSKLSEELDSEEKSSNSAHDDVKFDDDDFFSALEAELAGPDIEPSASTEGVSQSSLDDDIADLMADLLPPDPNSASSTDSSERASIATTKTEGIIDRSEPKNSQRTGTASSRAEQGSGTDARDFEKLTVPVLKEILRERGLKVSGKKAELVERLKQH